jgi:excisionase family DNA binding protein
MGAAKDRKAGGRRDSSVREELVELLREKSGEQLRVEIDDKTLEVSREALEALGDVLEVLERGSEVEVVEKEKELTTGEAAEMLNVSRPYLVDLLESGEIPFRKVGSHRRVRLVDVQEYREKQQDESRAKMEALAREDEKLDVEY